MNIPFRRIGCLVLLAILTLSACTPDASPAPSAEEARPTLQEIKAESSPAESTSTVSPSGESPVAAPTSRPSHTSTVAPSPTPSPTSTFTPLPTHTATPEPTPTPDHLQPGFYGAGGCVLYDVYTFARINFCVVNVEILQNMNMRFVVSWHIHIKTPKMTGKKRTDSENRNMYVIDNLGNRYDSISIGGHAEEAHVEDGTQLFGWFNFPPPKPGANTFTFYDDDNNVRIEQIVLTTPIIIHQELLLHWYAHHLDYRIALWEAGASEQGGGQLAHLEIPECQIIEWEPSEPQGKLKNVVTLGETVYEIYGWNEASWSVREYRAVSGLPGLEAVTPHPLFRAVIPYTAAERCVNDISEVFASLRQ